MAAPHYGPRVIASKRFSGTEPFDENVGDTDMAERLVDVLNGNGSVIHTYPVTLGQLGNDAADAEYLTKALEAAASGHLVPDTDLASLKARNHVARGGQMATYGDDLQSGSETKIGLEQQVRERAYSLWEEDGRPDGRGAEHWQRALDQHLRERAYVLWQQEGCPEGRADEPWQQLQEFQAQ
jgi:Protein of unknown function (DUF2934)